MRRSYITPLYPLADVPAALPAIVDAALQGDVSILTTHNQPVAVVIPYTTYQRLTARFATFMQLSPLGAADLLYERDPAPLWVDIDFD